MKESMMLAEWHSPECIYFHPSVKLVSGCLLQYVNKLSVRPLSIRPKLSKKFGGKRGSSYLSKVIIVAKPRHVIR